MAEFRIAEARVKDIAERMDVDPDALTTVSMVTWGEIILTILGCADGAKGDDTIVIEPSDTREAL